MIEVLEEEVRQSGFEYSAEFLRIAASTLKREASLIDLAPGDGETSLEKLVSLH